MKQSSQNNHIAIVGMGCIFPQSRNLKEYWHLLFNNIDAIQDIPGDTHWKLKDYFDEDPATPDHTYCTRGGFLPKIEFDPLSYGIPPNNIEATDTSQLLGLEVAKMALEDAGYPLDHPILQEKKVNVILGVTGTQELVIPLGARLGHPIWKQALNDSGIPVEKQEEVLERIGDDYVQWQENSFPGLLGNVVAGRIANRLNLSGTNTVTDAACASSLSAIHSAIMELNAGKCDMSITGGVDALNDIFMHMCFSKTGVLSHTSDAKPFSKDADGTVLGEGIGMLVLKRLKDAERDKDRIYAVIKGLGTSSDGKTSAIYAPDSKGQLKALKEAYKDAQIDPATVELIEAHGTGTRVGDKVEFTALKECFNQSSKNNQTAIGSVKSMIGHTKAAAGAAGIIKTALALHNKAIPATLKAQEPDPELEINQSAFYLNDRTKPWVASSPRRSGISAFGFGGSNFHVVLEEYSPTKSHVSWDGAIQIIAFSSSSKQGLKTEIQAFHSAIQKTQDDHERYQLTAFLACESRTRFNNKNAYRLLIVHKRQDMIQDKLDKALYCLKTETSTDSIYFASTTSQEKIGFLFPGQGSQYTGMGKDIVSVFPEAMDALNAASDLFSQQSGLDNDSRLQDFIFPLPSHVLTKKKAEEALRHTHVAQPAIGAVSLAMINILKRFGVTPQMACGHSFGELSALCSAGWMDESSLLSLAVSRGKYMAQAGNQDNDPGSMLAIQAPIDDIKRLIDQENLDLVLANQNSPAQGVLSGTTDEILRARKICRKKKMRAVQLPVAAAFHSSLVEKAAVPFAKSLKSKQISATDVDVLSNTTGTVYKKKKTDIKTVLGNQLANPVHFIDNIETMFEKGIKTFIEVGPKAVLTGLVKSILKDKEVTALSIDPSGGKKSGIEDLAHLLSVLASQGTDVNLTQWEDKCVRPEPKKMSITLSGANPKPKNRCTRPKSELMTTQPATAPVKKTQQPSPIISNTKSEKQSIPKAKPALKGSDMTSQNRPQNETNTMCNPAMEAMKMVQKGLEAMQQLQTQTAQTHEKFLETQAQASKTLASMLDQTQHLAFQTPRAPDGLATVNASVPASPVAAELIVPEQSVDPASEPVAVIPVVPAPVESAPVVKKIEETVTEPNTGAATNNQNQEILFDIVSHLTGFPVEMLEPDMDIESDLGIDSIKKVEIISELEKQIPSCEGLTTEAIGSVRTLKDICDTIESTSDQVDEISTVSPVETATKTLQPAQGDDQPSGASSQAISSVLFNTISELTGFPVEMLEPSMNLESDLGIDSIKRVEILSKLEQELESIQTISSDEIAGLKTIEEIINHLSAQTQDQLTGDKRLWSLAGYHRAKS